MNCILLSLHFTDCSRFHVQRKASLPKSTSSFISYHIASNSPCHSHAYSNPFLANSTFLAASPALNPPLLTHAAESVWAEVLVAMRIFVSLLVPGRVRAGILWLLRLLAVEHLV